MPDEGSRKGYQYPLYDDLIYEVIYEANLAKIKAIGQDERVQACWSVNGRVRFKVKN